MRTYLLAHNVAVGPLARDNISTAIHSFRAVKPINSQIGEALDDQPIEAIFEPMPANLSPNYYLKWGNGERV
jgi:hypothetical protein